MADYLSEYVLFGGKGVSIKNNPSGKRCNWSKDKGGEWGCMENAEGVQRAVTPPDQPTQTCSSILTPSSCNCLPKLLTSFHAPLLLQFSDKTAHFKKLFGLLRSLGQEVTFFFSARFLVVVEHFAILILQVVLFRCQVAEHHAVPFPFRVILPPRSAIMRQTAHHAELHRISTSTKEWPDRANSPLQ